MSKVYSLYACGNSENYGWSLRDYCSQCICNTIANKLIITNSSPVVQNNS